MEKTSQDIKSARKKLRLQNKAKSEKWLEIMAQELNIEIKNIEDITLFYGRKKYLDMSSVKWVELSLESKEKYSKAYQRSYSKYIEKELSKKEIKNGAEFEFSMIPTGKFLIGSPEKEQGRLDGEKQEDILVSKPFYISKYPITQQQWKAITGESPSYFKNAGEKAPVEQISAKEIEKKFLPKMGKGYRLPNEVEWEYACRAGTLGMSYIGNFDNNSSKNLNEIAWNFRNSEVNYEGGEANPDAKYADIKIIASKEEKRKKRGTHETGKKKPNAWGLYDMLGNVREICWNKAMFNTSGKLPTTASKFYSRGGSWANFPLYCRAAIRIVEFTNWKSESKGFRIIKDLKNNSRYNILQLYKKIDLSIFLSAKKTPLPGDKENYPPSNLLIVKKIPLPGDRK